jgi:hypothetical protein
MTSAKDFPHFDVQAVASQGNAVLGIRDSGKSYTAVGLAERFHDAQIPFVAFDPIGKWRFLRMPGQGIGYPVVVAGGMAGDLPLTVETAPSIVRAAMENGISLVIDLYDMEISKADWRRIVAESVRVLLYENGRHGLRHIFIEEAAEFCPQRPGPEQSRVYAEIEKLARMGGNARLGYTLVNQRAEEVSKAVLELCDNLFLHRQKGKNSLVSLSKWLDVGDVKIGKQIVGTLPTLPQGECWAWMAGTDRPVRVKVPPKNSFEPDRRAMRGDVATESSKKVEVGEFVAAMKAVLASSKPEGESPAKPAANGAKPNISAQIAEAEARGFERGKTHGYGLGYADALAAAQQAVASISVMSEIVGTVPTSAKSAPPPRKVSKPSSDGSLDGAALNLLRAINAYPVRGLSWDEACIVAGIIPGNGYFYRGKKQLIDGGHVAERDGKLFQTSEALPKANAAHLTRRELAGTWMKIKSPGDKMLAYLVEQGARAVSTEELASAIGAKPGNGYWYTGVKALRSANLIAEQRGSFRLADFLVEAKP